MNAENYSDSMSADEPEQPYRRSSSTWLLLFPAIFAGRYLVRGDLADLALWGVVLSAVLFGAAAVWAGRGWRQRLAGALAPLPVLAVGWAAIRLLSPGWALVTILAAFAAVAAALLGRRVRHARPTALPTPKADESSPPTASAEPGAAMARPRTPAENRAATEMRWAEGAERDRQQRAALEAEYERAAEQRRREAAERREAESSAAERG